MDRKRIGAEFVNPFTGVVPPGKERGMTGRELLRAIRQSLAAEEEAVHLYEAIADGSANEFVSRVMQDVADEEKVHAGEFQRLLDMFASDEEKFLSKGKGEVDEMAEGSGIVGSLKFDMVEPRRRVLKVGKERNGETGMNENRIAVELVKLAKELVAPSRRAADITPTQAKRHLKGLLDKHGVSYKKLTAKTVGFSDLARGEGVFVKIHGWKPNPLAADLKKEAKKAGYIIDFGGF